MEIMLEKKTKEIAKMKKLFTDLTQANFILIGIFVSIHYFMGNATVTIQAWQIVLIFKLALAYAVFRLFMTYLLRIPMISKLSRKIWK